MLLGARFDKFIAASPVSVMVQGTLERVFDPEKLRQVFDDNAVLQYTKELTFDQCVHIMSDVVFQVSPSVGAWYKTHDGELSVTRQSVYDKLKHIELPISAGLVRYSYAELLPAAKAMGIRPQPLLAGYRVRALDGNHLSGTDHRILETRRHRAAVLPGQALAFYDPQWDLISDVIPCECGHAQERSLTEEILAAICRGDCVLADRNFFTTRIVFGIKRAKGFFVIRQHKTNVEWKSKGKKRCVGQDERGRRIEEQAVVLTDPQSGETFTARRITIHLDKPTKDGEMEIHIITNLPAKDADGLKVASLYADRWTIETAFQHLTEDLRCEINTLGYRTVERYFPEFQRIYDECYAKRYGPWRPIIGDVVRKFLRCGDLHFGFARVRCPKCHHEMFVPFSCQQRCLCPSCHQKRSLLLAERMAQSICQPVPHRQIVWTIPKRVRVYFRFDRRLLGELARAAWETIVGVYRNVLGRDEGMIDRRHVREARSAANGPSGGTGSSWAALVKRVYEVDPLECAKCRAEMRIIAFIERCQRDVVEKILRHCGLWEGPLRTLPTARGPPNTANSDRDASEPRELQLVLDPEFL